MGNNKNDEEFQDDACVVVFSSQFDNGALIETGKTRVEWTSVDVEVKDQF